MTEKEMLAAAIEYTKRGWVVHPLSKPIGDIKRSPGKRPILKKWEQLEKTPDLSAFPPGCNIGLVCGEVSGVTVVDVDSDLFMYDVFNGMEADIGTLRSHRTRGRCHIFFKYNPRLPASKHHALGLEILSNGNNAVLPPSKHISGDDYVWDEPENSDLKEMPIKIEENLIRLFKVESELNQLVKKCRHCFRDVLSRKPKPDMHGADGRQYMMAVCTDLKAKGAKEEHALMFAKMMYGHNGYDEAKTLDEWRKLNANKTWTCDVLSSTLSSYVDPDQCEKCAKRKERYAEERGGRLNESLGDAIKGVLFRNKLSLATEMQKHLPIFYDRARNYWIWNPEKKCWERSDETDILNAIRHATQEDVLSSKVRSEILTAIQLTGRERALKHPEKTWIQFKDKVYDLKKKAFFDATPEYFFTSPIAYSLGASMETPVIDKLFVDWVGEKEAPKLYEVIAYSLLDDYPIHRMFWLIGSGRNGKGQFFKIITKLLGIWNTTTSTLERLLESRFEVATLYTKKVVFMGETDFSTLKNTAELKRLTGDDMIRGEMKFKDQFDFWNTAKLVISTNSLPQTLDKTDAFFGRSIIFEFVNRYEISKSVVDTIPEVEFENLALKCVDVLSDLLERGAFKDEGTIEVKARRYAMHSEHVIQFLTMTYKEDVNGTVECRKAFDLFMTFCNLKGYRRLSFDEFKKAAQESFEVGLKNIGGVKRVWIYGIEEVGIDHIPAKEDKKSEEKLPELPTLPTVQLPPPLRALRVGIEVKQVNQVGTENKITSIVQESVTELTNQLLTYRQYLIECDLEVTTNNITEFAMKFTSTYHPVAPDGSLYTPSAIKGIASKLFKLTPVAVIEK